MQRLKFAYRNIIEPYTSNGKTCIEFLTAFFFPAKKHVYEINRSFSIKIKIKVNDGLRHTNAYFLATITID